MDRRVDFDMGALIDNRWTIERRLAAGGFGSVYIAMDGRSGRQCAIKMESVAAERELLKMELAVLKKLGGQTHACRLLGFGRVPNRVSYVVMTLLGPNLYDLQRGLPNRRFNGATTARLAIQCLEAIQALHNIGYVHRDIKPANFAMGRSTSARIVHLIDFGLARRYWKEDGPEVAAPRANIGFRGTIRYASVAAHRGGEHGRRDDLCSLMYILVEFRIGGVPWRALEDKQDVVRMKQAYGMVQLTRDMEQQYGEIGRQVLLLRYADEPNYEAFIRQIQEMQLERNYNDDGPFEWEGNE